MIFAFEVLMLLAIVLIALILYFLISWTSQMHRELKEVQAGLAQAAEQLRAAGQDKL
jgi:uncharacterized membrane protein